MLTQETLLNVLQTLNDKTKKQEVRWGFRNGAYAVDLPNSIRIELRIQKEAPGAEHYDLLVFGDGAYLLGDMKVTVSDPHFTEMKELAEGADRAVSVFVSGQVLDVIRKEGIV